MVFTSAQKVTKHLGYFYSKICCQEIPKIAQSGHTGRSRWVTAQQVGRAIIGCNHSLDEKIFAERSKREREGQKWRQRLRNGAHLKAHSHYCVSASVCGRWLRFCREIENFLSLRWRSPLRKMQTAVSSVKEIFDFGPWIELVEWLPFSRYESRTNNEICLPVFEVNNSFVANLNYFDTLREAFEEKLTRAVLECDLPNYIYSFNELTLKRAYPNNFLFISVLFTIQ